MSWNLAHLIFQANCFGNLFPHTLPCVLVCLLPFSTTMAPALLQRSRSVSLPSCVSVLPTFFNVASLLPSIVAFVLSVFGSICGHLRIFDIYLVVLLGGDKPSVLLLHCYLLLPPWDCFLNFLFILCVLICQNAATDIKMLILCPELYWIPLLVIIMCV